MSGLGSRFKSAGYSDLKPLIRVHGKAILQYVVDMFPGEHSFIFICREDHFQEFKLDTLIAAFCANSTIVRLTEPYLKLGPVFAVMKAASFIEDALPVMVSYCDYFMRWNFSDFIAEVEQTQADGNIVCYTGFHPHLLHEKNVYAGCRVDSDNNLLEIKEKYSFESDKSKGFHSVGAYYFKTGKMMKHYMNLNLNGGESLGGEHYVSLVYPLLLNDRLKVGAYDKVSHFCQWGTPQDLEEYLYWSSVFNDYKYL